MSLMKQEHRTGAVVVIVSRDAPNTARQYDALLIDAPISLGHIVKSWTGADGREDIAAALLDRARQVLRIDLPAGSTPERAWQLEGSGHAAALARSIIQGDPASPLQSVSAALNQLKRSGLGDVETFERVAQLWGTAGKPIVVVVRDDGPDMRSTIRSVVGAVEFAAAGNLMLVIEPGAWQRLLRELDDHTLALLSQNVRTDPIETRQEHSGSLNELRQRARQAVAAAKAVAPTAEGRLPEEHSAARSLAEALLFAALQADHRTTGLFQLNAAGGFSFGPREVEIDLLCAALRIALEVDGYFHFQDSIAYRRDRAKDWLMQRHGLLVLRFLAEDVPDELEAVVDRVAEAVAHRRKGQVR